MPQEEIFLARYAVVFTINPDFYDIPGEIFRTLF